MGEWKSIKIDSGTGWKEIYREAGTGWKPLTWEYMIEWDFEDDTIGENPIGWTINNYCTFKTIAGKAAQYDQISGSTTGKVYRALESINTDNKYTIEYDVTPRSTHANTYGYNTFRATSGGASGINLGIRNTGYIASYSGGWYDLVAWVKDTKYTIKIYNIDFTNHQFDIDINGTNRGINCGFTNNIDSIAYISLEASSGYSGTLLDYDNIKEYET